MTTPSTTTGPLEGIARALVVGLGASGRAAARLLAAEGVAVVVTDRRSDPPEQAQVEGLERVGVRIRAGESGVEALDEVDLVVPSPGVAEHAEVLVEASRRGLPVWSEPELALRLHPRTLLAVTGTNGKTSTTELLGAMVAREGARALVCGNIGLPVADAVPTSPPDAILVAELSSFQLRFAGTLRPRVGVLLNLAPDHLDWHADLDAYAAAKARLWEAQQADDWAVANEDEPATTTLRDRVAPGRRAAFRASGPVGVGVGVEEGWLVGRTRADQEATPLVALAGIDTRPHHLANIAAAATAAMLVGVGPQAIAAAAHDHRPGRHRLEVVVTSPGGITYVDDSKATNPHAAAAALRSYDPVVWIAGGLAKGVDLRPLADDLGSVRAAVLIGSAAEELAQLCASVGVPATVAESVEDAVEVAAGLARAADTVLLAPACASLDQFRDYAERGDRFAAAARRVAAADQGARS